MRFKKNLLIALIMIFGCLNARDWPRYFDRHKDDGTVILTICYPTMYAINSIIGLRDHGLMPAENIRVVGIFHEDESSDYEASISWAETNNIDWIDFHRIEGTLHKDNLWQENPCSDDFKLVFKHSHGLILFGGADVPPSLYGDKTLLLTEIRTPHRHFFELSLLFHFLGGSQNSDFVPMMKKNSTFPVLGLCLGAQSINVAAGGTLVQDIWFELYERTTVEDVISLGHGYWHNNPWVRLYPQKSLLRYTMHPVKLDAQSIFVKEMGMRPDDYPFVTSSHHQAVRKTGQNIRITATSVDGMIAEAIEHQLYPNVLGTQFHPEFATLWDEELRIRINPDDEPFSLYSVLKSNPPSYAFHEKLWAWFFEKISQQ